MRYTILYCVSTLLAIGMICGTVVYYEKLEHQMPYYSSKYGGWVTNDSTSWATSTTGIVSTNTPQICECKDAKVEKK